jgi:erythromycin esterase-like protein
MLRSRAPRRSEARAFLEWARENAIPLDPGRLDADPERLAPLDLLLAGRRIAFLGEANHWIHEKYAYRLLLIRYLHSRGWRIVGEELGWSDGLRVDRYLETGDASALDRVSAYGYEGAKRGDRDDAPTGALKQMFDLYPEEEFRAEQRRFDRALRALNEACAPAGRLRLFGFDVDYEPGCGYETLFELLMREEGGDGTLRRIRDRLRRVEGESLDDEIARLRSAIGLIEACAAELEALLGADRARSLHRSARTTRASHEYVRLAHAAPRFEDTRPAMALRERLMHEHVEHVLAALGPADRLILMSHNLHLARRDDGIHNPDAAAGPGGGEVPSLGAFLHGSRPDEIFAVWMLEGRGADSRPLPGRHRVESPSGTLNALLSKVGPAFVLPTASDDPRARLLTAEIDLMSMYGHRLRARIAEQVDALVFVREVSPLCA